MKKVLMLLMCSAIVVVAFSQEQKHIILDEVEVGNPIFTGVNNAVYVFNEVNTKSIGDYLASNFNYPTPKGIDEGTEVVKFVITTKGKLTDFNVVNSLSPEIDAEVIRVLKTTDGMWIPGTHNKKPVNMESEVNFAIKVGDSERSALQKDFLKISQGYFDKATNKYLVLGKPKKALRYYNMGIRYMPNDRSLLLMRGLCKYDIGDKEGACNDWHRLKELGGIKSGEKDIDEIYFGEKISGLKWNAEMLSILNE